MTPAEKLAQLDRLKRDRRLFAAECLRIKDKSGGIVPLVFNRTQQHIDAKLDDQLRRTGKVRALLGKGRQGGGSTYIAARFYHRVSMVPGLDAYILTHEQPATDNLFDMVTRFYENSPMRPHLGAANAKELFFDKLGSGYTVGTAGTKATGRSRTIQLLHWSEVAFSANASGHFAGILQAVPDLPGTEIVLESTGNGPSGEFYETWQQAIRGEGDFMPIFAPWFWSAEYSRDVPPGFELDADERKYQEMHGLTLGQMAWRRAKLADLKDPQLFQREYPATAEEMFQATGAQSFIGADLVLRARKRIAEGIGPLIVGVDPARFGDDRFSVAWRRGRKVHRLESRHKIGTTEALAWLRDIIDQDEPDAMFIDAGGGGDRLFDLLVAWGDPYASVVRLVNFGSPALTAVILTEDGEKRAGPKNRRAEMWLRSRDWLDQPGGADVPDRDSLQADATGPGFRYDTTTQQLILESKEQMRSRGVSSPDEWDAVVLTFAEPVAPKRSPRSRVAVSTSRGPHGWMEA